MNNKNLLVIFLLASISTQAQDGIQSFIDSIAARQIKKNHGCGLVIGINMNGTEQVFSYGETEKGSKKKPEVNSIFEIGQLTQVFTSAMFAQMTVQGKINPDEPLRKFLPVDVPAPVYQEIVCEPVTQNDYLYEKGYGINEKYTHYVCKPDRSSKPQPILLCYLGTQTSGLPKRPDNLNGNSKNPYANYSKENLYEFLRGYSLPKPIGYDYQYSDLNMALLGHVMSLKTGRTFDFLLDSTLLGPLEMKNTKLNAAGYQSGSLMKGHNAKGKATDYWTFDIMAPAGALHSDLYDMMKLLAINISTTNSPLKNIFDYTHNPRIRFNSPKYGTMEAALGWLVSPLQKADKMVVWQEGLTGGFSSYVGFVETTHTGVVILSNSAAPVSELGKEILRKLN